MGWFDAYYCRKYLAPLSNQELTLYKSGLLILEVLEFLAKSNFGFALLK